LAAQAIARAYRAKADISSRMGDDMTLNCDWDQMADRMHAWVRKRQEKQGHAEPKMNMTQSDAQTSQTRWGRQPAGFGNTLVLLQNTWRSFFPNTSGPLLRSVAACS
jgi:hypothetical protein